MARFRRGKRVEDGASSFCRPLGAAIVPTQSTARARHQPPSILSMEDHIFYEEIGAGSFSTVYKGRQKRSVEFVAIRRVERSHRNKIYAEVQALHSLDHANVLKFHAWFATTNHLWVVTEYCAGGDLRTLLRQDHSLRR